MASATVSRQSEPGGYVVKASEMADPATSLRDDALPLTPRWTEMDAGTVTALSERAFKILVFVVCGWSLLEAPLELGVSNAPAALLALFLSKLVMLGTGLAAVAKVRFARGTFAFICGASVLAIAPALPMEFNQSFTIAMFSALECFCKAACVIAFGVASSREIRSHP
jgi:hypothetical protein